MHDLSRKSLWYCLPIDNYIGFLKYGLAFIKYNFPFQRFVLLQKIRLWHRESIIKTHPNYICIGQNALCGTQSDI